MGWNEIWCVCVCVYFQQHPTWHIKGLTWYILGVKEPSRLLLWNLSTGCSPSRWMSSTEEKYIGFPLGYFSFWLRQYPLVLLNHMTGSDPCLYGTNHWPFRKHLLPLLGQTDIQIKLAFFCLPIMSEPLILNNKWKNRWINKSAYLRFARKWAADLGRRRQRQTEGFPTETPKRDEWKQSPFTPMWWA